MDYSTNGAGACFLNPPYLGCAGPFVDKLLAEFRAGHVTAAITLLNGAHNIDTSWFSPLWNHVLCFPRERIEFYGPSAPAR